MSYGKNYFRTVEALERLNKQKTVLHKLPAGWKVALTVVYLLLVLSSGSTQITRLFLLGVGVFGLALCGKVPFKFLGSKIILALPFIFFVILSGLFFQAQPLEGYPPGISLGMIMGLGLLLKTMETISLVTILMATTKAEELLAVARKCHVPAFIQLQWELMLRYIDVLVEEIGKMHRAYILKNPGKSRVAFQDVGNFLGLLLLRPMDRGERIYRAMKCRGY